MFRWDIHRNVISYRLQLFGDFAVSLGSPAWYHVAGSCRDIAQNMKIHWNWVYIIFRQSHKHHIRLMISPIISPFIIRSPFESLSQTLYYYPIIYHSYPLTISHCSICPFCWLYLIYSHHFSQYCQGERERYKNIFVYPLYPVSLSLESGARVILYLSWYIYYTPLVTRIYIYIYTVPNISLNLSLQLTHIIFLISYITLLS